MRWRQNVKTGKIGIVAILIFSLYVAIEVSDASTIVVNGTCVKGDFYCDTIQEAVDMAEDGDVIIVCPGTYVENVRVDKSVSIQSYAGSSSTIIESKYTPKNMDEAIRSKGSFNVFNISADYVKIRGFTIKGGCPGIFLNEASHCNISDNLVVYSGFSFGIWLRQSHNVTIKNNNITKPNVGSGGIGLFASNNITIENNIISNRNDAIWMNSSSNNVIKGNLIKSNENHGIYLLNCHKNIIEENTILDNEGNGVDLNDGSYNTVRNNTIISNYDGISLDLSDENSIEKNIVSENTENGISLDESHGNLIKNNDVKLNDNSGIELDHSSNNTIEKNTASDNLNGIKLDWDSNNNTIKNNVLKSNSICGIYLYVISDRNTIEENIVQGNHYGIAIESGSKNNIVKNNVVNSNSEMGILIGRKSNGTIIEGNIVFGNDVGIRLTYCHYNIISNNIIKANIEGGIDLYSSHYNIIENNNIMLNRFQGIHLWGDIEKPSIGNLIYHNNIIDNNIHASLQHPQVWDGALFSIVKNNWYSHLLLEGNYWSDYKGADDGSGIGKHAIAGDGIGDTEIPHPDVGYDMYPFMNESGWLTFLVSPKYWDFGEVYQGDFKPQQTFELQNRGKDELTILNITADEDVEITGIELPVKIPAGASKTFTVKIDTKNLESDILKTLQIISNDKITPNKTILMYGFVKLYTPSIRIEKTKFESRVIKGQINLFQISVRNTGVANETNITVNLIDGNKLLDSQEIPELKKNETKMVKFKWDTTNASLRIHEIKIEIISSKGELLDQMKLRVYITPTTKASTFIVTNFKRMADKWGSDISELEERLIELSFHPSVNGIILRVENETNCSELYEEWDKDKEPEKANKIANVIKNLIDSKLNNYPNIEYLIIVGDDRIIPFYRIKDNTRESYIGPEEAWRTEDQYLGEKYGNLYPPKSTIGFALFSNYYLTDDFYADFEGEKLPIELHIPDKPIGRLVESPEEIISTIDTFMTKYEGYPTKIFITGHDFMYDGGKRTAKIWNKVEKPVFITPTPDNFSKIEKEILGENDIMGIFLHAEHSYLQIPLNENEYLMLTSLDISNSSQAEGAVIYSMSCHSGLNVPEEEDDSLDLVQSFMRKKIAAYIAPTGYGVGGVVTVAGHERLLEYFVENLCEGEEVGKALISAKRDYYLNDFHQDYLDEKVISSMVLYGLPMYRVNVEREEIEQIKSMAIPRNQTVSQNQIQKYQIGELEIDTLTLRPSFILMNTSTGVYYQSEDYSSESGKPIMPKIARTYFMGKKKIHGLTLRKAKYDFIQNAKQSIEFFTVSGSFTSPYEYKNWYPSKFFKINTIGDKQTIVIVTGQFNVTKYKGKNVYIGGERLFKELTFDIYLSSDVEEERPRINRVECQNEGNLTSIRINATDNSGILKVIVTYTYKDSSNGEWVSIEAERDVQKQNEYNCKLKGDVEFFVQAVDIYGNVAFDDNKGQYYPEK